MSLPCLAPPGRLADPRTLAFTPLLDRRLQITAGQIT
jgi:hypothetical protein